jgi:kanamycin nucleotidyltransferase
MPATASSDLDSAALPSVAGTRPLVRYAPVEVWRRPRGRSVADPQPVAREARLGLARDVAARAWALYGASLLAVGVYGSTARGTDGPYSDLEMFCVLRTWGERRTYEWVHEPWKAEVDVYSADVLLAEAARVEDDWPLTHGSFEVVLPLHDPEGFFERPRVSATSQPEERFREAIAGIVVGELYEDVAKVRNAMVAGHAAALPQLALVIATHGAYAIGLANRRQPPLLHLGDA